MKNTYIELDERNLEIMENISELLDTDYELKENFISVDSLMSMIKDLKLEITRRDEKIEQIYQNIEDNYRPLTNKEIYGEYEDFN